MYVGTGQRETDGECMSDVCRKYYWIKYHPVKNIIFDKGALSPLIFILKES